MGKPRHGEKGASKGKPRHGEKGASMGKPRHEEKGISRAPMEFEDKQWDIKNIRKEIELIGSSCMTWKERKDLENKKVVELGGKAPKKQRLPLSVARPFMKNQKAREQKLIQERLALGRYGGSFGLTTAKKGETEKRRLTDTGLKASAGSFRSGILNVRHLMKSNKSSSGNDELPMVPKVKKMGGDKNNKKKGGNNKRR